MPSKISKRFITALKKKRAAWDRDDYMSSNKYKFLGSGYYSSVYADKKSEKTQAIKIDNGNDKGYAHFVKLARKAKNKHFAKVYDTVPVKRGVTVYATERCYGFLMLMIILMGMMIGMAIIKKLIID